MPGPVLLTLYNTGVQRNPVFLQLHNLQQRNQISLLSITNVTYALRGHRLYGHPNLSAPNSLELNLTEIKAMELSSESHI